MSWREFAFLTVIGLVVLVGTGNAGDHNLFRHHGDQTTTVSDGAVTFGITGSAIGMTTDIDGARFYAPEVKKVSENDILYTTGEKSFWFIDDPEIAQRFQVTADGVKETLTLKSLKEVSYRLDIPGNVELVAENGGLNLRNPKANEDKDGYIRIEPAVGIDASGAKVSFGYDWNPHSKNLKLVWPETADNGNAISYPIVIDPTLKRAYDVKLLLHFNNYEDDNASIFHFVDSSRYFSPMTGASASAAVNLSPAKPSMFGNASFRSTGAVGDYVYTDQNSRFNLSNNLFVINLFVNSTGAIGTNKSILYGGGAAGSYSWVLHLSDNAIAFDTLRNSVSATSTRCTVGTISANRWHQITLIKNNSPNGMNFYQNGTLICSVPTIGTINFPAGTGYEQINVPYGTMPSTANLTPFTGYIDEVSLIIGGGVRAIGDVYPSYEYPLHVNSSSWGGYADDNQTVSLLHLNGVNNGVNFTDQTGKVWRPESNAVTATNQSEFGGSSLYLPGDHNSWINTSMYQDFNFSTTDFTVEFWLKNVPVDDRNGVITTHKAKDDGWDVIRTTADGHVVMKYGVNSANMLIDAGAVTNNTWMHVAFVRSGTNVYSFVNGLKTNTTDGSGIMLAADGPRVGIGTQHFGAGPAGETYSGWIDELRVSKTARYTANFTVPYYPFELANASFIHSEEPVGTDTTVLFTSTSPDANWTNVTHYWYFGDGVGSYLANPSHAFSGNGTFTVEYQTINNNMSSTATDTITIGKPSVAFHASPTSGTAALEVAFTDDTTNLTPIIRYGIEFGDGDISNETPPWTHVYDTYGVFTVNLTEWTADGSNWTTKRDYIVTKSQQTTDHVLYPREVTITVTDTNGKRLPDVTVNASAIGNSFPGGTKWLQTLYGIDADTANDIQDSDLYMTSTTGDDGAIVFTMIGAIKYRINLTEPTTGVSTSVDLFPRQSEYSIQMAGVASSHNNTYADMGANTSLWVEEPNASYVTMHLNYQDISGRTMKVYFKVTNATNGTVIYSHTSGGVLGTAKYLDNFTVPNDRGITYTWNYSAERKV